eukprot:COSAG06_NODE_5261_length_3601_cov_3.816729_3_plen_88_part_00
MGGEKWEGMTDARADGDRIGMLLDQDEGSLTVYKNDRRCGVMLSSGLAGNFRWAASLQSKARGRAHRGQASAGVREQASATCSKDVC